MRRVPQRLSSCRQRDVASAARIRASQRQHLHRTRHRPLVSAAAVRAACASGPLTIRDKIGGVSTTGARTASSILREARHTAGLTQAQLAERAGVTQSVISAYESSRREPALSTLNRLVEAAGLRLDLQLAPGEDGSARRILPAQGLGGRVRRLRRQVLRLVAAHGGTGVGLFGSAARGDDRPDSDVDLLVDLPDDISLFEIGRLAEELQALLGARVDVVPERSVKPAVRARINQDLVPL